MIFSMILIIRYSEEDNIQINKTTIKKVNQAILKYKEVSPKINIESNQIINQYIEELKEKLEKDYLEVFEKEEQSEETKELMEELETTKALIINYEKKIADIEKNYQKIEKILKHSRTTSKNLENIRQNLQITVTTLKQEIISLNQELKKYQSEIKELLQNNQKKEQAITFLSNLNESLELEIKTVNAKNVELNQKLEDLSQKLSLYETKNAIQSQTRRIREIIITELYNQPSSIEDLIKVVNREGYSVTPQIINEHLNALKNRVNMEGPLFETIPPIYKLNTNPLITPNPIYLPSMALNKEVDVLLISDLHKDFYKDLLVPMDIAYNYSSANNISYIFNLGDNFNTKYFNNNNNNRLEELKRIEQWIKEFSDCIPQNTGIYLLNLGGNHDRFFLKAGIDPLSKLQEYRPDFINLGYDHVNIVLGDKLKTNNCLALHHPSKRIEETIGESLTENSRIKDYFSGYYHSLQNNLITRDMIYCDILAHLHRSKLDVLNSYCQVPSYTRDRVANGAWHLKIYFNSQKNIECITFIPLVIMNNQLKPVSEIQYQKVKSK